jgi:regulatory protein YycI of two-component signal transduction system YycFG
MRISVGDLIKIKKELGEFEVGTSPKASLTLRFGYWKEIELSKLNTLLPYWMVAEKNLVDEDEDCGELYNYTINKKIKI